MALRPDDWLFVTYRQTAASMYWDVPFDRYFARLMGTAPETIDKELPLEKPLAVNIAPIYALLAVNVTNVGSAMTDALEGRDVVSLAYIGDGSKSLDNYSQSTWSVAALKRARNGGRVGTRFHHPERFT